MDSVLKITYYIYDIFGNHVESDSYANALAAFKKGRIVYEVHETTNTSANTTPNSTRQYGAMVP